MDKQQTRDFFGKPKMEVSFMVWDKALEDLLRTPVNPDLKPNKNVKWRPASQMNTRMVNIKQSKREINPSDQIFSQAHTLENSEFNAREVMIHNLISAPLSPRKKQRIPCQKRFVHVHDQHTIEKVYHQRSQKFSFQQGQQRKTEHKTIARNFSIPINHGVTSPTPFRFA